MRLYGGISISSMAAAERSAASLVVMERNLERMRLAEIAKEFTDVRPLDERKRQVKHMRTAAPAPYLDVASAERAQRRLLRSAKRAALLAGGADAFNDLIPSHIRRHAGRSK